MTEQTLNIPQLVIVALVGFFAIRWFFYSSSPPSSSSSTRSQSSRNAANPAHVDQVAQMFPQLGRREIAWDLQRNGGSVAATTERILSGRGLDTPPPSFQPQQPASSVPTARSGRSTPAAPTKPAYPDLITRYNLSSKLTPSPSEPSTTAEMSGAKKQAWSANKNERQQLLQRRREEMILAARRKMEEKDRAKVGERS